MRIAVTYDKENGQIFQHFGHTEQFKLYQVENGRVVSSVTLPTNGTGHGALAALLAQMKADVLICGGIGGGAGPPSWNRASCSIPASSAWRIKRWRRF